MAGVYLLALSVSHINYGHMALVKDGKEVFQSLMRCANCALTADAVSWILEIESGEKLTVIYRGFEIKPETRMVLTRLGN